MFEPILVMEALQGGPLLPDEFVHHINCEGRRLPRECDYPTRADAMFVLAARLMRPSGSTNGRNRSRISSLTRSDPPYVSLAVRMTPDTMQQSGHDYIRQMSYLDRMRA